MERLVVVGASLAGLRAVEAARRHGFTGDVVLVGGEAHLPYDRPPLTKAFLAPDDRGGGEEPWLRTEEHLTDELGVALRLGAPANALDPDARAVIVGEEEIPYSAVVIATGAAARALPDTENIHGVHTLRTLDDARAVRAALDAGARTVVVGAGFVGSEVAAAARLRGLDATIVEALDVPLARSVGPDAGHACAALHEAAGTDLRCGVGVIGVDAVGDTVSDKVSGVRLSDGSVLPADLVVVGIGVAPNTAWLSGSGVPLHGRDGGVVCDERLWTGVPGVYAAGDVAHWPNPLFDGELMRLEHWSSAAEQAAVAARNAVGPGNAASCAAVPYFWSDWYEHRVQFVGIPGGDEIRVVSEELGEDRFLALYRDGDRLVGALAIDRPGQIMKYRRLITRRARWAEAVKFARQGASTSGRPASALLGRGA